MNRETDWLVLRCASVSTLRLADSLVSAGFEAWTPREEVRKAVRGKFEWVVMPMLPTFVFATAARLGELMAMARSPAQTYQVWDNELRRMVTKGHPFFRLFHIGDEFSRARDTVPDAELLPLRVIEGRRKRKPRGKPRQWHPGDRVKLTEGAYEGLRGVIRSVHGKTAIVDFGFKHEPMISTFVLLPDLDSAPRSNLQTSQYRHAA